MNEQADLKAYLDGELDAARAQEVAQAVQTDPALARELDELRALTGVLRSIPMPAVQGREATIDRLMQLDRPSRSSTPWMWRLGLGAAVTAALIYGISLNRNDLQDSAKAGSVVAMKNMSSGEVVEDAASMDRAGSSLAAPTVQKQVPASSKAVQAKAIPKPAAPAPKVQVAPQENWSPSAGAGAPRYASPTRSSANAPADPVAATARTKSSADRESLAKQAPAMMAFRNEPSTMSVRTDSIEATRARLVALVHKYKGTINLGQRKDQPMTADIQIPAANVNEFQRDLIAFATAPRERDQLDADATLGTGVARGGLGGGGGGFGGAGSAKGEASPRPSQPASADRAAPLKTLSDGPPARGTKDRHFRVILIPSKNE